MPFLTLLLGKGGQVGWELQRSLVPLGHIISLDRLSVNLTNSCALDKILTSNPADIIVNAAAFTAVDRAETESSDAYRINANAVAELAFFAKRTNALLVHYSTDYVFDGAKSSPYLESDATNSISVYGKSKLLGEQAIINSGCKYLIFRTSWVFATRGQNFVKTIIKLAGERKSLRIVADQIGAPTSAELIADATAHAIRDVLAGRAPGGLYHLTASGNTSWHGYAQFILDQAKLSGIPLKTYHAEPISTAEYPLPAARPANSQLDTTKLQNTFGLTMPDWRYHVARTVQKLAENYR
jgi:dTDP-4-dehydrorhamnose reductase